VDLIRKALLVREVQEDRGRISTLSQHKDQGSGDAQLGIDDCHSCGWRFDVELAHFLDDILSDGLLKQLAPEAFDENQLVER